MDPAILRALETDRTIDITTVGRRSGEPQRIEMWFHNVDGTVYITGTPGTRDWYANMVAEPWFTFHLKESIRADLRALARPVTDTDERERILGVVTQRVGATQPLDDWVERSPLVEVSFA